VVVVVGVEVSLLEVSLVVEVGSVVVEEVVAGVEFLFGWSAGDTRDG
jgi:hypothetical protein